MASHPRLDQLIASLGYGSRRQVAEWIGDGRVRVGPAPGTVPRDGSLRADPHGVRLDGEPLDHPDGITLLLHKPLGLVCSHDPKEGRSVYDLLPERWRRRSPVVTSVGRLDKETSGLLILTDQTRLVHKLTSPRHKVRKVYRAVCDRDLPEGLEAVFASGTLLLSGETEPCAPALFERLGPRLGQIAITEGRFHQVRRMFASQHLEVTSLHRSALGDLELGDLAAGAWREIDPAVFG